jgi:magnesium transporter
MDAFASIISNNQNNVIKVLTSVTIMMSIPTIIASLYGMNVGLPYSEYSHAFWGVLAASLVLVVSVILIFRRKDWF